MFVREHQNQFRGAQADVQRFYGTTGTVLRFGWNKPVGARFVYIMLVGGGGAGSPGVQGGGTGAITVWFGAAKNIPNSLTVQFSTTATSILSSPGNTLTTMFLADAANTSTAGVADTVDGYYATGFYGFTAGADGDAAGAPAAQTTTFLLPGGFGGTTYTGNYGYTSSSNGYFLLNPIIVGVSGSALIKAAAAAAYGCGSNSSNSNPSPGMAIIASW